MTRDEAPPSTGSAPGPAFFGRAAELDRLHEVFGHALASHGRLAMLVGEPGIGKTRTAAEFLARARARGARVLEGRCHDDEGAPPYWPWQQALRGYVESLDGDALRARLGPGASDVAQVVAAVKERLPELEASPALDPDQSRFRFFDSVTRFLIAAAAEEPLVILLEDLHWSDPASLQLLLFLAREMATQRILVLASYRDVEIGRTHPLSATLAALRRETVYQRIPLRGLSDAEARSLATATCGRALPEAQAAWIVEETEGNPFFVEEVVRHLMEEGLLGASGDAPAGAPVQSAVVVPEGVRDVIGRRLSRLGDSCNGVLATASVLGREFSLDLLSRVDDLPREGLLDALREGVAARLLHEPPDAFGAFRFSHALVRETLYAELSALDRAALHRRAVEALEALHADDVGPHLAALAHHALEAFTGGEVERAVDYARRAGDQAVRELGHEEAARLYGCALQALALAGSEPDAARCQLMICLGEARRHSADEEGARQAFLDAAALARRLQRPELQGRAALGLAPSMEFNYTGVADPIAEKALDDAIEALGPDDPLRARLLAALAMVLVWSGSPERRVEVAEAAVACARRSGDVAALAFAQGSLHMAIWAPDNTAQRLEIARGMKTTAEEVGEVELSQVATVWLVDDLFELGDWAGAEREIAAYRQVARARRQPSQLWYSAVWEAMGHVLRGPLDEGAEQAVLLAHRAGGTVNADVALQTMGLQLLMLRREQGRMGEMAEALRGYVEHYTAIPAWRAALAWLLVEDGQLEEARAEVARLERDFGPSLLPRDLFWVAGMTALSHVCVALEDRALADRVRALLEPHADHVAMVGYNAMHCLGPVSHYLGLLAATAGREELAESYFGRALTVFETLRTPVLRAWCDFHRARLALRSSEPARRKRGEEFLASALEVARSRSMTRLERWAREFAPIGAGEATASVPAGLHRVSRDGSIWVFEFRGETYRSPDSKGLECIARLLAEPDRELHVLELVGNGAPARERADVSGLGQESGSELLDEQARSAYRSRIAELRAELAEAEAFADAGRTELARSELEMIEQELARAVGLGGRARRQGDPVERARKTVYNRIRNALRRLESDQPELGRHLTRTIETGIYCVYRPDDPEEWEVRL